MIGFSRAVQISDRILVSDMAPVESDGSCEPDPAGQIRRCLEIISDALSELDASLDDVVRTVCISSMRTRMQWARARGGLRRAAAGGDPAGREGAAGRTVEIEVEAETWCGRLRWWGRA